MNNPSESDTIRRVVRTMFGGRLIVANDALRFHSHVDRKRLVTPDMVLPVVQALVCSFSAPHDGVIVEMHTDNPFALVVHIDTAWSMLVDLHPDAK